MKKYYEYGISKYHSEIFSKPIRTQTEAVLVLLEVVGVILNKSEWNKQAGKVCVCKDKMSRVFLFLNNKYFSMHFPFSIEQTEDTGIRIYDANSDITMDFRRLGLLKAILKEVNFIEKSIDEILEDAYFDVVSEEYSEKEVEESLRLLFRILTIEFGYLRYDYDEKHYDKDYHPLTHIDINFMSNVAYKIGSKNLKEQDFIDLVNIRKKCHILS